MGLRSRQPERLSFKRSKREADACYHRIPRPLLILRIHKVETVDGAAPRSGEIASAIKYLPVSLHRNSEERSRDPLVVQRAFPNAKIFPDVSPRSIAGLVIERVNRQHRTAIGSLELFPDTFFGRPSRHEHAGRIVDPSSIFRDYEGSPREAAGLRRATRS
jgi:hypothetical protein